MSRDPADRIVPPFAGMAMIEPLRLLFETAGLFASAPLLAGAPRGDGHPVIVLPGFATSDAMTLLLRHFIAGLGYQVHPWLLGWNFDQHSVGEEGQHIAARIAEIAERTGEKVSLIGWSLGGVIAREAARRDHGALRQVITLGSPFTGNPEATNLNTLYQMMTGNNVREEKSRRRYRESHRPLPVPSSALYSRTDGITAWENCVSEDGSESESIEVASSHFGFVANPAVFWAVADRLAQPQDGWRPFAPRGPFAAFYAGA